MANAVDALILRSILRKDTLDRIQKYVNSCFTGYMEYTGNTQRKRMELVDKTYYAELEYANTEGQRARSRNDAGNLDPIADVEIPIVAPQVESGVDFHSEVFLSDPDIFGVTVPPGYEQELKQFRAILSDQARAGNWYTKFEEAFRCAEKYNFTGIGCEWSSRRYGNVLTALQSSGTGPKNAGRYQVSQDVAVEEKLWHGNVLRLMDPYNTIYDFRVPLDENHTRGEFVGYVDSISRVEAKKLLASLNGQPGYLSRDRDALEAAMPKVAVYYIPKIISKDRYIRTSSRNGEAFNWFKWLSVDDTSGINYTDNYELKVLYARIMPAELKIRAPKSKTPQVWKIVMLNDEPVFVGRTEAYFDEFPIYLSRPYNSLLGTQAKSLAEQAKPFQVLVTSLGKSLIHSRRRAINDRLFYNKRSISESRINSSAPDARVPVKLSLNDNIHNHVAEIPYRDTQSTQTLQAINMFKQFADQATGNNATRQGQFIKGNKTQDEFGAIMASSYGRQKRAARSIESQLFQPLQRALKANIMMYQGADTIFNPGTSEAVDIDPVKLRKALIDFKLTNGVHPTEQQLSTDVLKVGLQSIATSNILAPQYNVNQLFSYLISMDGGDITPFEKSPEQVAYEQAVQVWSQQAQLALQQGVEFKVPQPTPEQFNYTPGQLNTANAPMPSSGSTSAGEAHVNNIVNNISNNRG